MEQENDFTQDLAKLLLPKEVFEFFEITSIASNEKEIHIHLDEINTIPCEYKDEKLLSKGFHPSVAVQDFPIRNKATYLHIKRRRWLIEGTDRVISRDWEAVAKGTRLTKEFAIFLKGLFG